jgi:NAD+ synthase
MRDFNPNKETNEISRWLREYATRAGVTGYVIGLSGGIDSTLVANLAVNAVGSSNVVGVIMPIYSPKEDKADAYKVAESLGIETIYVDLQHTYETMMIETIVLDLGRLERANIKARLRMTALYAVAGKRNRLVVGTGNKSEDMIGYFTKYGDGGVDVLPIADYYKWEVKKMARYLKVDTYLVERTPTAALWEGQTDESDIGMTYDELDRILYFLLEQVGDLEIAHPNAKKNLPSRDKIDKVENMINNNKHKVEYPPIYRRY